MNKNKLQKLISGAALHSNSSESRIDTKNPKLNLQFSLVVCPVLMYVHEKASAHTEPEGSVESKQQIADDGMIPPFMTC